MPEGVKNGCFIVFDGAEGGGKSTQAELVRKHYQNLGLQVRLTREPGGTRWGV